MGNDTATVERRGLEVLWEESAGGPTGVDAPVRWADGGGAAEPEAPGAERWHREQLLARGACLGDEGALETLCRDEWYHVHKLVSGSVPDPVDAEELTLEVFARAIDQLSHFPYVETSFRSYLLQFARAAAERPLAGGPDRRVAAGGSAARGTAAGPSAYAARIRREEAGTILLSAEQRRQLVAALDRLPERSREVLHLRLLEGRSTMEISADWGRTPDAVRRVQCEALQALRSEVEGHGPR